VSAGLSFVLALRADGTLWAWGRNQSGQLGDGTTVDRDVPTQVGTATDWLLISAGGLHSLAVKTDWTLWSWGNNSFAQLGSGNSVDRSAPAKVGKKKWMAIAAGRYHSHAVMTDETLWGWGRSPANATTVPRDKVSNPTQVPVAAGQWIQLTAGSYTFGLRPR
jgi:alpha-tubulin suppressor-like RCC1 family protein